MEARSLILAAEQYTQVPTYDLLLAAEQGFAGIDHRFLHAIVDDPEKSIPDLLRFGLEEREDRRDDLSETLIQIFRHLRTPRSIPYLLAYLRRNHLDTTIPVICAFQEIGAPAVEPLLEFYREVGEAEDSDVGFLLGSLGVRDPRILEVLTERLKTDPADAAHCLAVYGDPAAIPAVIGAIDNADEPWVAQSLEACVEDLRENTPRTDDEEPFDLWALYPEESDPRFDLLTPEETELFLDSPEADNRFAAISVLSQERVPPPLWDRLLRMAREDPDIEVRAECWRALVDGWERADIRQAMHACLADESASATERAGAMQSLAAREGGDEGVQRAMLAFYEAPSTRAKAIEAMALSGDPGYEKYFRKHIGDPDRDVFLQAMLGVGLLEMESEAPRLVRYFKDEELREDALSTYALSASCEPTRAGLRRLYKKIEELARTLSPEEAGAVEDALNIRAERYDLEPVFGADGELLMDEPVVMKAKVGRNDPCPCGSGKKYKKCCGA